MPVNPFGFESGANGDVIETGNTGASAVAYNGGTAIIATAQKRNGTRSILFTGTSTAGACYAQFDVTPTTTLALRVYVYMTALPSADTTIMWVGNGISQRANVEVTSAGAIRFRDDASGAQWNGSVNTSVGTLTLNTWYRIEFRLTQSGTARLAVFLGDSLTPVTNMDSGARTGLNFGADNFSSARVGVKASTSSVTSSGYFDDFAYDPAVSSTFIGPYTEVLPTPVVTLGTTTNPTTVGGSNGSQVVTWPAVPGATAYDAYIDDSTSPAQGDFTLVAAGVTSPYTFTGLDASPGTYAYGIKARA